jgi:hypothetical protein
MRTFNKNTSIGDDYILAPAGTQPAALTCLAIVGHHDRTWQGETKRQELCVLAYELGETATDGRALSVTETLTFSLHEKAKLFARITALNGGREPSPGEPLNNLLGKGCIVTIDHTTKGERTYANITQTAPLLRGMPPPTTSVKPIYFDLADGFDAETFEALPARARKLIEAAMAEGQGRPQQGQQQPQQQAPQSHQQAAQQATQTYYQQQAQQRPTAPPAGPGPDDDIPF